MNIPDHIFQSLVKIFWVPKFFDADPGSEIILVDPVSGIEKIRIRDKHPDLQHYFRLNYILTLVCRPIPLSTGVTYGTGSVVCRSLAKKQMPLEGLHYTVVKSDPGFSSLCNIPRRKA